MFASVGGSTVGLLAIHLINSHSETHNCQDKRQETGQRRRGSGAFDEICKFHIRMNSDSPFQVGETSGVIHWARITVQTHTLTNLTIPHLHVRPSVLFEQRVICKAIGGAPGPYTRPLPSLRAARC